jgi:RNA polymerase sigma-70 factor, ECF subfamily
MTPDDIAAVFRAEYGRAVAVLIGVLGDIDLAEDAVADAFATALQRWPGEGAPPSPAGWIITTARHRAVDQLRRETARARKHAEAALAHAPAETAPEGAVPDDRLRLVFTCCHPALARPAQVALTLRLLGGLTTPEIARAFFVPRPRWRNGSSGRRRRSVTRASLTGYPARPTCPNASTRCSQSST